MSTMEEGGKRVENALGEKAAAGRKRKIACLKNRVSKSGPYDPDTAAAERSIAQEQTRAEEKRNLPIGGRRCR